MRKYTLGTVLVSKIGMYVQVRSKALVQYTAPFVTVHLPTMATAFNIDCK